jgi:hypothetical protein
MERRACGRGRYRRVILRLVAVLIKIATLNVVGRIEVHEGLVYLGEHVFEIRSCIIAGDRDPVAMASDLPHATDQVLTSKASINLPFAGLPFPSDNPPADDPRPGSPFA